MNLSSIVIVVFLALGVTMPQSRAERMMDGVIRPMHSTSFYAPSLSINVRGWQMTSSASRINFLVEEGSLVKKGDVLAKFDLDLTLVLDYTNKFAEKAKVDADLVTDAIEQDIKRYETEAKRKWLHYEQQKLDLKKRAMVAPADYEIMIKEMEIARFEAYSVEKIIAINRRHLENARAYHKVKNEMWQTYLSAIGRIEQRFTIKASADGYVSFPTLAFRKHKAKVGSGIMGGWGFLDLATSTEVTVEFYLPEEYYERLHIGDTVKVEPLGATNHFSARVRAIVPYPLERGLLEDDFSTAYASEKVFVIKADPIETRNFTPGLQVKVGPIPTQAQANSMKRR